MCARRHFVRIVGTRSKPPRSWALQASVDVRPQREEISSSVIARVPITVVDLSFFIREPFCQTTEGNMEWIDLGPVLVSKDQVDDRIDAQGGGAVHGARVCDSLNVRVVWDVRWRRRARR